MSSKTVKHISECFIRPKYEVQEAKEPYYLALTDLAMLSGHYIQKGLLFAKPSSLDDQRFSIKTLLQSLKDSLSFTLVHFYPLTGQLVTQVDEDRHQCLIFVDCSKGPGARFIHATLDMSISDIVSSTDVPVVVQAFFDHDRAVNHDGHYMSLLTVQVTELQDGVFIGCSMNHAIADGTSYWHFWNKWSEIHRGNREGSVPLSRLSIHKRWFPDGYDRILLPFTKPEEFVKRFETPKLRERIFHFSPESIAKLKAKANKEKNDNTNIISSFQALSALCWRAIIRALMLPHDQDTKCGLAVNNRHRLDPPLPQAYLGNCISALKITTTVGELLEHNLGWTASRLHQSVIRQNGKLLRELINWWLQNPFVSTLDNLSDSYNILIGSSPRFDMYGNEFGLGKALCVRSGYANKFEGKVTSYPGNEGEGSVDLEICLSPDAMAALESDEEFLNCVSSSPLTV